MKRGMIFWLATAILWSAIGARAEDLKPEVVQWLEAQTNINTWSADFVQTRKLASLAQPLTANGHVWFAAPNKFRWELGHPPQTIAVRAPEELLIFYPNLKRVEKFPLGGNQAGQWRDALTLLEAGFPRSRAELESRYDVLSQTVTNGIGKLVLQPKSAAARRMMPKLEIDFDTQSNLLRGTELQFADGSTMRNDFKDPKLNPTIEPEKFSPSVPPDYKVVEPTKAR